MEIGSWEIFWHGEGAWGLSLSSSRIPRLVCGGGCYNSPIRCNIVTYGGLNLAISNFYCHYRVHHCRGRVHKKPHAGVFEMDIGLVLWLLCLVRSREQCRCSGRQWISYSPSGLGVLCGDGYGGLIFQTSTQKLVTILSLCDILGLEGMWEGCCRPG